jgi:hypothetical protein
MWRMWRGQQVRWQHSNLWRLSSRRTRWREEARNCFRVSSARELIAYFPFSRHGPHTKRCFQQLFYCCMCIRCRRTCLPSRCLATMGRIHIHAHRQSLLASLFPLSGARRVTDVQTARWSHKPPQFYFQIKESRLKTNKMLCSDNNLHYRS